MRPSAALTAVCCITLAVLGAPLAGAASDQLHVLPGPANSPINDSPAQQHMQAKLQQAFEQHPSSAVKQSEAPSPAGGATAAAKSKTFATVSTNNVVDDADIVYTTYFRPQEELTTDGGLLETDIPGLAPTDPATVRRSIPNLENWSPLVTLLAPFLPAINQFTNSIGFYLPFSWPLASVGPISDWLRTTMGSYWQAFWGEGPRPELAPSLLVANVDAYRKLPQQIAAYSGLPPPLKLHLNPIKAQYVGWKVYDQLMRNMMVPRAPMLMEAANGTRIKTQDGIELTLVVKPDGRFLVSNTTTLKIIKEIFTGPPFPATIVVVDSFVVPKIRLIPRPPAPLLTQEEIQQLPQIIEMFKDALSDMPAAILGMPAAVHDMLEEQQAARLHDPSAPSIMDDIFRVNLTGPLIPVKAPETSVADLQVILDALLAKELEEQGSDNRSAPPSSGKLRLQDIVTLKPMGRRTMH